MPVPESSRALLLPGPQPPLSHFGATLLRHVLTTGLRYALHGLGAKTPDGAPMRIVRLRLYLDRKKLVRTLGDDPGAEALIAALLEPGGAGALPANAGSIRGALGFHRLRLHVRRRKRLSTTEAPRGAEAPELWHSFRTTLTDLLPALNEALLGELVATLDRRAARAKGRSIERCLGPQAFALRAGKRADLSWLGVADPLAPAWSESPGARDHVATRLGDLPPAVGHRLRGDFRETYRRALGPIRAAYLRLAAAARERGLIEEAGDAFFIPFDLAEDLTADRPAAWLPETVASNRREYQSLLEAPSPPELLGAGPPKELIDDRDEWALAPLWPLE